MGGSRLELLHAGLLDDLAGKIGQKAGRLLKVYLFEAQLTPRIKSFRTSTSDSSALVGR